MKEIHFSEYYIAAHADALPVIRDPFGLPAILMELIMWELVFRFWETFFKISGKVTGG